MVVGNGLLQFVLPELFELFFSIPFFILQGHTCDFCQFSEDLFVVYNVAERVLDECVNVIAQRS